MQRLTTNSTSVVQPVIHREIDKTEVRHVIQPVYLDETVPTQLHEKVLPPEYLEDVNLGPKGDIMAALQRESAEDSPTLVSIAKATETTVVVNEPIVHETSIDCFHTLFLILIIVHSKTSHNRGSPTSYPPHNPRTPRDPREERRLREDH